MHVIFKRGMPSLEDYMHLCCIYVVKGGGGVKSFVKVVAIKIAGEMVFVVVELNNLYKVMPVCVC